jgi:isocitrate dehydrogenase kinase/phosphatase
LRSTSRTIRDGFDKHYRLFRATSQQAQQHFERGSWAAAQTAARERIDFYDKRVQECVQLLEDEYDPSDLTDEVWRELKLHYIGMLSDHKQPELAETFFNSVCCNILHRSYFHNEFIFVRPVTPPSTSKPPNRARPTASTTRRRTACTHAQAHRHQLPARRQFANLARCRAGGSAPPRPVWRCRIEPNHQIQVLSSLFFRNKGAYIVGKSINGNRVYPFVVPILHNRHGELILDTVLCDPSRSPSCSRSRAPTSWSTWKCRRPTCSSCAR